MSAPAAGVLADASRAAGVARTRFSIELGGAFAAGARLPRSAVGREVDEVVDSAVGLAAWVGSRSAAYGLVLERLGLGKDHYATSAAQGTLETLNVSYLADTLWLAGRWYLTDDRPAFYLSLAAGPSLPRARATGTRASADALVRPPEAYDCAAGGRVGAGVAAAGGAEFDVAESWSLLGEARVSGHFLSNASDTFGGCAPATGAAVGGALRLGAAYRFGE